MPVRTADARDIPELVRLWIAFMDYHADLDPVFSRLPAGADNWTRYITAKMEEDDFHVFVAEEDGILAGYTVAFLKEYPPIFTIQGCGFIDEIFVDPEYRGRGVGRDLYHAAEKWLKGKGVDHLELKVDLANEPSRRFWKSLGFEPRVEIRAKRLDPAN